MTLESIKAEMDGHLQIRLHLSKIQKELNAPKNQLNKFGGYNYRSCEDIIEAVKKLLPAGAVVSMSDEVVMIGDRYYVKATATFMLGHAIVSTTAYAREPLEKKGSDASQITGAASSYARKYALNGLFAIDDGKDSDATNEHAKPGATKTDIFATPKHPDTAKIEGCFKANDMLSAQSLWERLTDDDKKTCWKGLTANAQAWLKQLVKNKPKEAVEF